MLMWLTSELFGSGRRAAWWMLPAETESYFFPSQLGGTCGKARNYRPSKKQTLISTNIKKWILSLSTIMLKMSLSGDFGQKGEQEFDDCFGHNIKHIIWVFSWRTCLDRVNLACLEFDIAPNTNKQEHVWMWFTWSSFLIKRFVFFVCHRDELGDVVIRKLGECQGPPSHQGAPKPFAGPKATFSASSEEK